MTECTNIIRYVTIILFFKEAILEYYSTIRKYNNADMFKMFHRVKKARYYNGLIINENS